MKALSRVISWIFIPLNAPVFALLIAMYLQSDSYDSGYFEVLFRLNESWKLLLLIIFAFFSIAIPGLTILFLRFSGAISDVMIDKRKERILPSLFVNASAIALYIMLVSKDPGENLPSAVYALSMGSLLTVFACTIITRWWKISLHAAGMGIISGFIIAYYSGLEVFPFWVMPVVLILSGVVMSARMYLGKHSLAQCLTGFFLGGTVLAVTVIVEHSLRFAA